MGALNSLAKPGSHIGQLTMWPDVLDSVDW